MSKFSVPSIKDSSDPATIKVGLAKRPTSKCFAALPISCTVKFSSSSPYTLKASQHSWSRRSHKIWPQYTSQHLSEIGFVVSFGFIDDASAPISSSPTATLVVKYSAESVKPFGSVPAAANQLNGKSSVFSTTKPPQSHTSSVQHPLLRVDVIIIIIFTFFCTL
ncbi:hypothetical protein C8R42DRAFT_718478 [Lentinula raphanica]|nr:hypothetical protein C8R42DRAFT_718478 [Lentinula raphanica]KAJ3818643.1 hypothetical protein F5880DRAFT_1617187 [Lentinula raphanica]